MARRRCDAKKFVAGFGSGPPTRGAAASDINTNEMLTAARAMGLAERDFAVLFEALARMAGVKNSKVE